MNKQQLYANGALFLRNVYWLYLALPIKSYNPLVLMWRWLNLRLYESTTMRQVWKTKFLCWRPPYQAILIDVRRLITIKV